MPPNSLKLTQVSVFILVVVVVVHQHRAFIF
jgi:hypothetical protein